MELQGVYRHSPIDEINENPLINQIIRKPEDTPCSVHKSKALKKCREHLVQAGENLHLAAFKEVASHEVSFTGLLRNYTFLLLLLGKYLLRDG